MLLLSNLNSYIIQVCELYVGLKKENIAETVVHCCDALVS